MSDNIEKAASCNRVPFLSEDGCDRGDVDIHQFDDLPYCEEIEPTPAEIPPEVMDTPVNIPIPPPCSCINIDYKLNLGYGTSTPKATFKAVGDCCDGNYESNLSLNLPCPVPTGIRKIKTSIGYGNGSSSKETLYYVRGKGCSFSITDITQELQIGCPIKVSGTRKISISLAYGSGSGSLSQPLATGDTGNCSINIENPEFNLNLPCPVAGNGNSKITVGVDFSDNGDKKKEVDLASKDAANCSIDILNPEIELALPCPLPVSGERKMTFDMDYDDKRTEREEITVAEVDRTKCTMLMYSPEINLRIPCPIQDTKEHWIMVSLDYGMSFTKNKKIKYINTNKKDCKITPKDPDVELLIPCPLDNLAFDSHVSTAKKGAFSVSAQGGPGCSKTLKFDIKFPEVDEKDIEEIIINNKNIHNSFVTIIDTSINITCENGPICDYSMGESGLFFRRGRFVKDKKGVINLVCDCIWMQVFYTEKLSDQDCQ